MGMKVREAINSASIQIGNMRKSIKLEIYGWIGLMIIFFLSRFGFLMFASASRLRNGQFFLKVLPTLKLLSFESPHTPVSSVGLAFIAWQNTGSFRVSGLGCVRFFKD